MPRRKYKRQLVDLDPVYGNIEIAKLINYVMKDGKKDVAENIVYGMMERVKKEGADPVKFLNTAIANVAPNFEVKPRRLGGASYLVPIEVRKERKLFLAFNWIIDAATARPNKEYHTFQDKLLAEVTDATKNLGAAVAKKQQTEKLADANKAFAHLKW